MNYRRIGQPIIVLNFHSNGSAEQAAVVTRVWGPDNGALINCTVFPDCSTSPAVTQGSIPLFSTRFEAGEWIGKQPGGLTIVGNRAAFPLEA